MLNNHVENGASDNLWALIIQAQEKQAKSVNKAVLMLLPYIFMCTYKPFGKVPLHSYSNSFDEYVSLGSHKSDSPKTMHH